MERFETPLTYPILLGIRKLVTEDAFPFFVSFLAHIVSLNTIYLGAVLGLSAICVISSIHELCNVAIVVVVKGQ